MKRQLSYHDHLLILTDSNFILSCTLSRNVSSNTFNHWYEIKFADISKSKFFSEQIEYMGYWTTRQIIQPINSKVEAILNIKAAKTRKVQQTTPVYWYSEILSQHMVLKK
jgi:hypothetical protein